MNGSAIFAKLIRIHGSFLLWHIIPRVVTQLAKFLINTWHRFFFYFFSPKTTTGRIESREAHWIHPSQTSQSAGDLSDNQSETLRPEKSPAVAPSGQQQQTLSRRKPHSSSTLISGPTRIVYRESLTPPSDSDLNLPFWQRTWFILVLFVMALSFFALAIFLFLTLDSDYTYSSVSAATSEGVEVIISFHI